MRPETKLAKEAGLAIGSRRGIQVDDAMLTNDPHIFAVGDAIEVKDFVFGFDTIVPLAGPANRQGRIAADNALGRSSRYRGTQGTAIVGLFGKVAAMTGASEKTLRRLGAAYRKAYIHPANHAGYYPGAQAMTLKLLFDPADGRILGAQGLVARAFDKRIDVLAMAIQAELTVYDLEEAELCYAPQFGSAKDPINMLGFVASGLLRGDHPQVDWEQCDQETREQIRCRWSMCARQTSTLAGIYRSDQHPCGRVAITTERTVLRTASHRILPSRPARLSGNKDSQTVGLRGSQLQWRLQNL